MTRSSSRAALRVTPRAGFPAPSVAARSPGVGVPRAARRRAWGSAIRVSLGSSFEMFTVAVVGGGAAGIGAARRLLQAGARVLLFDPAAQLGGNCVGLRVADAHGEPVEIDVGVSDFNAATFREFSALLAELGLETQPIGADAHFATLGGETLAAVQNGVFTVRPRLRGADRLEDEVRAFRERAIEALEDPRFANGTLADYLAHHGCSPAFRDAVLLPRAMGCFPMPNAAPEHHELRALLRFWQVHGLVGRAPSDRRCVVGGMHRYPCLLYTSRCV